MLSKDQVRLVRERIAHHQAPVLSLYVDIYPARPENTRRGWFIRVKDSLKAFDIPTTLYEHVMTLLSEERAQARTLVLFAATDLLERYDLQVELPVVDLAHGQVECRWGEPYVTPLLYALDEYERTGVLYLDRASWRFYEIFLGEIEEATDAFRTVSPEEWQELTRYMPTLYNGLLKERVATHPSRFARRVEMWAQRFLKRLAHLLENVVVEHDIHRLVLLGPTEDTHFFAQYLSRSIRSRVVAYVSDIPYPAPSAAQVLDKVTPILEEAERSHGQALLDAVRERAGIWGLDPTLEALQSGRLAVMIVPWRIEAQVWRCPEGWVASTPEMARIFYPEGELQKVPLRDAIVELAANFGARLEFVRGEAEQRLLEQYGGLAGLPRW
ncbi:MAG: VLRF1 family aeRF1-type release factor [Anaerolineae bacterium]